MPPRAKFTREQIVNAALDIIRESGTAELTARALGKRLGSSACPIFTVFENMEEVMTYTIKAAKALYATYIKEGLKSMPAFKGVGMQYLKFAIREPKLFQLLFMTERTQKPTMNNVLPVIDDNYSVILQSVEDSYSINRQSAEKIYRHLWIYTHGIAVLCATNTCTFTQTEMSNMLTEIMSALLKEVKGESGND